MRSECDEPFDEENYIDDYHSEGLLDEVSDDDQSNDEDDAAFNPLLFLRNNLLRIEPNRDALRVVHKDEIKVVVPLKELDGERFVFIDVRSKKMFCSALSGLDIIECIEKGR